MGEIGKDRLVVEVNLGEEAVSWAAAEGSTLVAVVEN